jgi:hypothetical protein
MTKKPTRKPAERPALPASGGSWVRHPDGTLARGYAAGPTTPKPEAPAPAPTAAPAGKALKKES